MDSSSFITNSQMTHRGPDDSYRHKWRYSLIRIMEERVRWVVLFIYYNEARVNRERKRRGKGEGVGGGGGREVVRGGEREEGGHEVRESGEDRK